MQKTVFLEMRDNPHLREPLEVNIILSTVRLLIIGPKALEQLLRYCLTIMRNWQMEATL